MNYNYSNNELLSYENKYNSSISIILVTKIENHLFS